MTPTHPSQTTAACSPAIRRALRAIDLHRERMRRQPTPPPPQPLALTGRDTQAAPASFDLAGPSIAELDAA